jgi:hypothetical protein
VTYTHGPWPVVLPQEQLVGPHAPGLWRRWLHITFPSEEGATLFTAEATALALDPAMRLYGSSTIRSPRFTPLSEPHAIIVGGISHVLSEPRPAALVERAVDVCRVVALRLLAHEIDRKAVTQAWPANRLAFADLVKGVPVGGIVLPKNPPLLTYAIRPHNLVRAAS